MAMCPQILKACSCKFTPVRQFFYFDAAECLPDQPLSPEEVAPANSRYDGQIAVFGRYGLYRGTDCYKKRLRSTKWDDSISCVGKPTCVS